MAFTPEQLAEVDAALDHTCLELVSLARTVDATTAFRVLINAAYQIERARKLLLEEQSSPDDMAPLDGEDKDEASFLRNEATITGSAVDLRGER